MMYNYLQEVRLEDLTIPLLQLPWFMKIQKFEQMRLASWVYDIRNGRGLFGRMNQPQFQGNLRQCYKIIESLRWKLPPRSSLKTSVQSTSSSQGEAERQALIPSLWWSVTNLREWPEAGLGRSTSDIRKKFFIQRVVEHWNRLSRAVVTVQACQKHLDIALMYIMWLLGLSCAGSGAGLWRYLWAFPSQDILWFYMKSLSNSISKGHLFVSFSSRHNKISSTILCIYSEDNFHAF